MSSKGMVRSQIVAFAVCAALVTGPALADSSSEQGLLLAGGVYQDCQTPEVAVVGRHNAYANASSTVVGLSAICFEKPAGIMGYHVEYTPTVPCTFPATVDTGSSVLVYGSTGVVNQPFSLVWDYTTPTYQPPPDC